MRSGGCAGSGRALRLDPFGLPVRFCASDAAADGRVRDIELHRERVVLRRSLSGMRMALNMPVKAFDGISLQLVPGEGGEADLLAIVLEHSDPSLTLPLYLTPRPDEALAEWRAWSEVLGVPLLLASSVASSASAQLGHLRIERPAATPTPQKHSEKAPSVDFDAARLRQNHKSDAGVSRRARNHRAQLIRTVWKRR